MSDFYTTQQLADKLGIGPDTVLTYPKTIDGWPQPIRINGRTLRWPKAEIDEFLEQRRESPHGTP